MTAPESIADQMLAEAINCPHVIDSDRIVLHYDSSKPGHNALNQLSRRLAALASSAPAVLQTADGVKAVDGAQPHQGGTVE